MASIKKFNGTTWGNTKVRKLTTATDTLTTLPADVYADGTNATVGLVGNMSQSGTPTPSSPIQPSECGERTENEWNVTLLPNSSIAGGNYWEKYDSSIVSTTMYMPCDSNTTYYLYTPSSITSGIFRVYTSTNNTIPTLGNSIPVYEKTRSSSPISTFKFTTGANDKMLIVQVTTANSQTMADDAVLDKGYKIPILNNSQTTNVYLGEVETTRKIKKYEFTGTESISSNTLGVSGVGFTYLKSDMRSNGRKNGFCSHFVPQNSPNGSALDGITFGASDSVIYVTFSVQSASDYNLTDTTSIKAWLAQQYAAGTPVTVWYVLATEETGIVNEPIRKIGDYADEVSGISIPTIAGANTLSIGTTLQPSEVTATYKGWHPVADVHEAGRTVNIYDKYNTIDIPNLGLRYGIECELGTYSIYNNTDNTVYWGTNNWASRHAACDPHSTTTITIQGTGIGGFFMAYNDESLGEITIVQGSTVPDHYIPYIDWD